MSACLSHGVYETMFLGFPGMFFPYHSSVLTTDLILLQGTSLSPIVVKDTASYVFRSDSSFLGKWKEEKGSHPFFFTAGVPLCTKEQEAVSFFRNFLVCSISEMCLFSIL